MDKRFLNPLLLFALCFSMFFHSGVLGRNAGDKKKDQRIRKFTLVSVPIVHEHEDSIRVLVYFNIPRKIRCNSSDSLGVTRATTAAKMRAFCGFRS